MLEILKLKMLPKHIIRKVWDNVFNYPIFLGLNILNIHRNIKTILGLTKESL